MTRVELRLDGLISLPGGAEIALRRTFALLDGIERERSVRGAAARMGVSYRAAWGGIGALEAAAGGRPLVVKTKGHGSTLTEAGKALRDALGGVLDQFEAPLAQAGQALEHRLPAILSPVTWAPSANRQVRDHQGDGAADRHGAGDLRPRPVSFGASRSGRAGQAAGEGGLLGVGHVQVVLGAPGQDVLRRLRPLRPAQELRLPLI